MRTPLEVLIVSATRAVARGVEEFLEEEPDAFRCRILTHVDPARLSEAGEPDVVLLIPEDWEEMKRCLEALRTQPSLRLWLLIADWRVAGMFVSRMKGRICIVLKPEFSPDGLRSAVRMLASYESFYHPSSLLSFLDRSVRLLVGRRQSLGVTRREWECACAVALRLSNEEIAGALNIKQATVESHIHHLFQKIPLDPSNRRDLGRVIEKATASVSPGFAWI